MRMLAIKGSPSPETTPDGLPLNDVLVWSRATGNLTDLDDEVLDGVEAATEAYVEGPKWSSP